MKSLPTRLLISAAMILIAWVMLAGASTPRGTLLEPDKLVLLSTTDVKGKTSPCG